MRCFAGSGALLMMLLASRCSPALEPDASRSAGETAGTAIPIVRLRAEPYSFTSHSGMQDPAWVVVRSAGAWNQLWSQIWRGHSPTPPLAAVDFSREMLVVAALGRRSSGGHSIFVDSAYQRSEHIEVVVRKVSPGSQCMVTGALTEPVDIARLPASTQPVRFRERSVVHNCE